MPENPPKRGWLPLRVALLVTHRVTPDIDPRRLRGMVSAALMVEIGVSAGLGGAVAWATTTWLGWPPGLSAAFVLAGAAPLGTLMAWHGSFTDAYSAWDGRGGTYTEALLSGGRSRRLLDASSRRWAVVAATGLALYLGYLAMKS